MKVLMITGDKQFGPGHPRYELQRSAVDELAVVYWGRGSLWPRIPLGQFDVVTAQDPFWRGLFAWRVAKKLHAKLNLQVHTNFVAPRLLSGKLRLAMARFALCRADSIRVVSQKIKTQVEQLDVRAAIYVLPVYVDVSKFKNIAPMPHAQKTMLWLGRFEDEKDPLTAIEILKEVRKEADVKLVMLGKGSLERELRSHARGLPVEFPGWQDPAAFLSQADVVLSTSRHESWGASIVEALAAGVPVVAPDIGIAHDAGAVVVPRGELAHAVVEILRSGARGQLRLQLPTKEQWIEKWKESLL